MAILADIISWYLLAQGDNGGNGAAGGGNDGGGGGGGGSIFGIDYFIIMLIMLAFYFIIMRPKKREREKKEFLAGLKKNDRVVTIGGIKGVVFNVHRERDEVTLEIDESNKTKLKVTIDSIARVMKDESVSSEKSTPSEKSN